MDAQSHAGVSRKLPIGAEFVPGGVYFRVLAPKCRVVEVVFEADSGRSSVEFKLHRDGDGYHSGLTDAQPGMRYGLRLDGSARLFPDPASRFQPDGPEGLSELIDPSSFTWTDQAWRGLPLLGQVFYEMHVGTFTPEGTWAASAEQLPELANAGMTVLELMPLGDFCGNFGWGYDGVNLFAPTRLYGRPDDFRRFVDRAHAAGIAVILDVVYNHFGVVANYLGEFCDDYHTDRYKNDWAAAINYDGPSARPIREFFLSNVRYWIEEFHLDGFRIDATQAIYDSSAEHILTELVREARAAAGSRNVLIVAENEPQDVRMIRPAEQGGHGMDGVWNDDFHHAAMVRLSSRSEAYYSDFTGAAAEFLAAAKHNFIYQGQLSQWQNKPRGTSSRGAPAPAFVNFLQNHDQIANSARGTRVHQRTSPGRFRAMTALWLLMPQTPMFFMGQEFCASSPFWYFADNPGDIGKLCAQGRLNFLSQFPSIASRENQADVLEPSDPRTFRKCQLDFSDRERNAECYTMHRDLLKLRREDSVFSAQRCDRLDGAVLSAEVLLLRFFGEENDDRLLLVNFGRDFTYTPVAEPLLAPPAGRAWERIYSSESLIYGGGGTPICQVEDAWRLPGECALVFKAVSSSKNPPRKNAT